MSRRVEVDDEHGPLAREPGDVDDVAPGACRPGAVRGVLCRRGDAPVLLDLHLGQVGDAVIRILDLSDSLDACSDTNATVHTDLWHSLDSGLDGLDGLDADDAWPATSSLDTGDLSDQGSWNR